MPRTCSMGGRLSLHAAARTHDFQKLCQELQGHGVRIDEQEPEVGPFGWMDISATKPRSLISRHELCRQLRYEGRQSSMGAGRMLRHHRHSRGCDEGGLAGPCPAACRHRLAGLHLCCCAVHYASSPSPATFLFLCVPHLHVCPPPGTPAACPSTLLMYLLHPFPCVYLTPSFAPTSTLHFLCIYLTIFL